MTRRSVRVEVRLLISELTRGRDLPASIHAAATSRGDAIEIFAAASPQLGQNNPGAWTIAPTSDGSGRSFRLVSPQLKTDGDVRRYASLLRSLGGAESGAKVSEGFGLHLHLGAAGLGREGLAKLCQNFVKYEDAMDALVPPSRRMGCRGLAPSKYCRSCKASVGGPTATNKSRNDAIASCPSVADLVGLMNSMGGRVGYKLDLRNLLKDEDATIEFAQHSSTSNFKKIRSWIGFCLAMVDNSVRFKEPKSLLPSRTLNEQLEALFKFVIRDGSLQSYYSERYAQLASGNGTGRTNGSIAATGGRPEQGGSLRKAKSKKLECKCCFRQVNIKEMCSCQDRGHKFCKDCIRRYAEEEVFGNHKATLSCLSTGGCKSPFNTRQLELALPKRSLAKLHETLYMSYIEADGYRVCECPKCGTKGMIPKKQNTFQCPKIKCLHKSCRLCHEPAHAPLKCSEVERQHETNSRKKVEESMSRARMGNCPHCGTRYIVVGDGGCHTMTCNHCRSRFRDTRYQPNDPTLRTAVKRAGENTLQRESTQDERGRLHGIVEKLA